jgi:hypothetical protein
VDQAALKAASLLHFQDEASSLDFNRKMGALQQLRPESTLVEKETGNPLKKRRRLSDGETNGLAQTHAVQKFRYVQASHDRGHPATGYRELLATYVDVAAAAEDDLEKSSKVADACNRGGDFVGNYFYQYEV